jgi:hypothetical protein
MNQRKIEKLFAAARNEATPAPSEHFATDVVRAIGCEKQMPPAETFLLFDQLNLLFPRFAWVAAAMIVLGVATDFGLTATGIPNLSDGVSQVSAQWLLTPDGF